MVDSNKTQTYQTDIDEDCKKRMARSDRCKRIIIYILIMIIIILILLFHIFFFRMGRIGVSPDDHTSNTTIFKEYIYTCGDNLDVPNTDSGDDGGTGSHSCPDCPDCEEDIGIIPAVKVSDDQAEYGQNTEVNIFQNVKYAGEKIIAPGSSGQYVFYVQNISKTNISYDISFSDMMTNPVNMKYKLRVDNIYIRGSKSHYVDINELTVEDIKVLVGSNNLFFLEWYWADDDPNDTYTGSQAQFEPQTYTLNIKVEAQPIR